MGQCKARSSQTEAKAGIRNALIVFLGTGLGKAILP